MLANDGSHNTSSESLTSKLAIALPRDVRIVLHHISSNPTPCAAIFAAPPGSKPEKTFCESHFVTVSVAPLAAETELFIYAIEILIYTTEHLTTLFVSKADSTGYGRLVETPKGSPSLLKTVSSTLISHLVVTRQRPGVKLVVSLFARAQDQYLFPGSVENSSKHVLDDRGLVRWWSGVLDTVLRQHEGANGEHARGDGNWGPEDATQVKGYLIVPGCDKYETMSFLPPSAKIDPPDRKKWSNLHPLRQLATNPSIPPRCLIPHFPDDPKARFLDELDDELPDSQGSQNSPAKRHKNGQWKSVKTLEQFWELMAFRQECSSGRLVGFLWVVFTPPDLPSHEHSHLDGGSQVPTPLGPHNEHSMLPNPSHSSQQHASFLPTSHSSPTPSFLPRNPRTRLTRRNHPLTGPIHPRLPRTKPLRTTPSSTPTPKQPATTKHYHWPPSHRSQLVLPAKNYQRAIDLLLRLDFADRRVAENSTRRWVDEVGIIAGEGAKGWGVVVVGVREVSEEGMVRRKTNGASTEVDGEGRGTGEEGGEVRFMGSMGGEERMVEREAQKRSGIGNGNVNLLSEGLVRKKKKTKQEP